jgi:hypothetical protein
MGPRPPLCDSVPPLPPPTPHPPATSPVTASPPPTPSSCPSFRHHRHARPPERPHLVAAAPSPHTLMTLFPRRCPGPPHSWTRSLAVVLGPTPASASTSSSHPLRDLLDPALPHVVKLNSLTILRVIKLSNDTHIDFSLLVQIECPLFGFNL